MIKELLVFVTLAIALVPCLNAQPTDTCTGADWDGTGTLPITPPTITASHTFTPNGAGCTSRPNGRDSIQCFVPTNNCDVTLYCEGGVSDVGANVYDLGTTGSCSDISSSTPCFASQLGVINFLDVSLTAGRNYCFLCDHWITGTGSFSTGAITAQIGQDCGALPVGLLEFEVSGSE